MASPSPLRALISGTSSGIGRSVAERLLQDGATVHGIDVQNPPGNLLDEPRFVAHQGDVSEPGDWDRIVVAARSQMGGLDALVNVAGINFAASITNTGVDDWDRIMAINLRSVFLGCRAAIADLTASKGAIVNVSSVLGIAGRARWTAYGASKGGVITFTKALAAELGPVGVRVNCICPGPIRTEMVRREGEDDATLARRTVLGRIGEPREVADVVAHLLGSESTFVTGAILPVDGGRLAV